MKIPLSQRCPASAWLPVFLAMALSGTAFTVIADEASPESDQETFAAPGDAVNALRAAVQADDQAALEKIFGPEYQSLKTGDKVQDANNTRHFAMAMAQSCDLMKDGPGQFVIQVGTNNWPMPIPLVETNGQWHFDTAAGRDQIIDRHIGKDELTAIGVCRAYVNAQRQYARLKGGVYAQKFKSSPGREDGLYWPAKQTGQPSPFGALVAQAQAQGYGGRHGQGPHPFHGYYFRILTRQGAAAPGGKMNYLRHGRLTRGFALVAWPVTWGQSGIMTFIVNQDGTVYQRDFGDDTPRIGAKMKEYNPDGNWSVVHDAGIPNAASAQ